MVGTASAAVQQRVCVLGPAAKVNLLVPRLVHADHRRVDQAAHVGVGEELAPVGEGHPARGESTMAFNVKVNE